TEGIRAAEPTSCVSYRKIIRCGDDSSVTHIESSQSPVRTDVVGIRYQPRGVSGGGSVVGISVVDNSRERIDSAQRQTSTEAAIDIDLQRVVGAVALGHPGPRISEGRIGLRWGSSARFRRNEKRTRRYRQSRESAIRRSIRERCWARSRRTDHRQKRVIVHAYQLVI